MPIKLPLPSPPKKSMRCYLKWREHEPHKKKFSKEQNDEIAEECVKFTVNIGSSSKLGRQRIISPCKTCIHIQKFPTDRPTRCHPNPPHATNSSLPLSFPLAFFHPIGGFAAAGGGGGHVIWPYFPISSPLSLPPSPTTATAPTTDRPGRA